MFFVFHVLALTVLLVSKINSFTSLIEIEPDDESLSENEKVVDFQDAAKRNRSTFSTHKALFQIIQNLTKTKSPNLKSNVFDKMLSDEMFSIKQHFYKKDMTYSSSVHISTQGNIPTPTLEVKQKWPLGEVMSKLNNIEDTEQHVDEPDSFNEIINKTSLNDSTSLESNTSEVIKDENIVQQQQQNKQKVKVIDLRSLPQSTLNPIYYSKICTCMQINHMTTCTHRCTAGHISTGDSCNSLPPTVHSCNHKSTHTVSNPCPKCTSYTQYYSTTLMPYTAGVYPAYTYYVPYQSYFQYDSSENPYKNTYYHPDVLNELKIPVKPKHRKTTRYHRDDDLYYDNSDSRESQYDDYLESDKQYKQRLKVPKPAHKETGGDIVEVPIEYDDNSLPANKHKNKILINVGVNNDNQNKFVKDIIHDLKTYYGDTVIKDCYCSRSPQIGFPGIFLWISAFYAFAV